MADAALIRYDAACRALSEAKSIDELFRALATAQIADFTPIREVA